MYKEITSALRRMSAPTTWTAVAITLVLTGCNDDKPTKPQTAAPVVKRTTIKAFGNESERDPVIQSHPLDAPPMAELARLISAPPRAATEAAVRLDASTLIPESDAGVAYLFYGALSGELTTYDADATLEGPGLDGSCGTALASPGDMNGDGFTDLLLGAPNGAPGRAALVLGWGW